jgi:hypothetical protein
MSSHPAIQSITRRATPRLLALQIALVSGFSLLPVSVVYAQSVSAEMRYYKINAGSLSKAVNAFAATSGLFVGGSAQLLNDKRTLGFEGEYSTEQALELLLVGTGLSYQRGDGNSIVLVDADTVTQTDDGVNLSPLMVREMKTQKEVGVQVIGSEEIEAMPTEGGNLTDLLRTNTAVNYSRSSSSSASSASLRPDEISIHGQDYYQNAFMIDGVDTSSDFDPGSSGSGDTYTNPINPASLSTLSGGSPQSYYVDADALGEVKVYDSNVPVEYGGFTGGVVDAKLKKYAGEDELFIKYGLTQDSWEKFHVDESLVEDYADSGVSDGSYTPDYKKQNYSITALKSLTDNIGSSVTFSRKTSKFKQNYVDLSTREEKDVYYDDTVDNIMGRIDSKVSDRLDLGLNFKYSNRYYTGITSTSYTAPFERSHEAYGVSMEANYHFDSSLLSITGGFDRSIDALDSESSTYTYDPRTKAYSGGYGDITQQQDRYTLGSKWLHDAFSIGSTRHSVTLGAELKYTNSFYSVDGDITNNIYRCTPTNCTGDASTDYLWRVTETKAGKLEKDYDSYALFIQDEIALGNWTTTVGVRADKETLLGNTNIAPRAKVEWDVFGDDNTRLIAGASRYYGRNFLKYEINQTLASWKTRTTYNTDGSVSQVTRYTDTSLKDFDLKTPYSDELMLGWMQRMGPFDAALKLVNRESRDGVHRDRDENGQYFYENTGSSSTNDVSLEFEQHDPFNLLGTQTKLAFSIGWQESTSNSQSSDAYDETTEEDPVYYDGQVTAYENLPAWDYAIPFTIKLSSATHIPTWHILWSNFVNVKSGGTVAQDSGEDYTDANGIAYAVYEDKDFDDLVTVDTQIQWTPPLFAKSEGYVQLKVTNLFDDVVSTTTSTSSTATQSYTSGRKISMEVGMRF